MQGNLSLFLNNGFNLDSNDNDKVKRKAIKNSGNSDRRKHLFFRDRGPWRYQFQGAGGPAEKDLGRNRL